MYHSFVIKLTIMLNYSCYDLRLRIWQCLMFCCIWGSLLN